MVPIRRSLADWRVYYGWIVSILCFTALLAVFSINLSFGVFFDFIVADLEATRASASTVFSLQTTALYASGAVFGPVVDRYGTRRLTAAGAVLLGVGMFGASRAGSLLELLVLYGVVAGTGMGIIYVVAFTVPSRWFERRRGIATALATSGVGISTLAAPPIASVLIAAYTWQSTYLVFTVASVAGLVLVAVLIADDPWSLGVDASGEFSGSNPPTSDRRGQELEMATRRRILTSRSFVLVVGGWILIYIPFFAVFVHIVAYATDAGMARWVGVVGLSLHGGFSIVGRFVLGGAADRVGRPTSFVTFSVGIAAVIFAIPLVSSPALLLAAMAIFGTLHGGASTLLTPLIADFYGSEHVTSLYGVSALSFAVGAFAGPYFAGLTYETLGDYSPFFFVSALLVVLGAFGVRLAASIEETH